MRLLTTLLFMMFALSAYAENITTVKVNSLLSLESKNAIVNRYKEINQYLANGDIESASQLTVNPKQYHDKMSSYMERVGEAAFKERYQNYSKILFVHSVISIKDQHLLIVGPDSSRLGANGFIMVDDEMLLSSDRDSAQMKALYEEFAIIRKQTSNKY